MLPPRLWAVTLASAALALPTADIRQATLAQEAPTYTSSDPRITPAPLRPRHAGNTTVGSSDHGGQSSADHVKADCTEAAWTESVVDSRTYGACCPSSSSTSGGGCTPSTLSTCLDGEVRYLDGTKDTPEFPKICSTVMASENSDPYATTQQTPEMSMMRSKKTGKPRISKSSAWRTIPNVVDFATGFATINIAVPITANPFPSSSSGESETSGPSIGGSTNATTSTPPTGRPSTEGPTAVSESPTESTTVSESPTSSTARSALPTNSSATDSAPRTGSATAPTPTTSSESKTSGPSTSTTGTTPPTASTTSNPPPTGGESKTFGLSTGALVGIVVPGVTCLVAIAGLGFRVWKWRQKKAGKGGDLT